MKKNFAAKIKTQSKWLDTLNQRKEALERRLSYLDTMKGINTRSEQARLKTELADVEIRMVKARSRISRARAQL
jgi:hypothetical protein